MTDKQALREKFEAWAEEAGALPWGYLKKQRTASGNYSIQIYTYMWHAWSACHEALLDELEALQSFRTAFNEWHDKTEWVQCDKRFDVIKPWGKHRADVLKLYIENLESKLEAKEEQRANWFQMAQKLGEDLDAAEKRIAELEARTVKLPPTFWYEHDDLPREIPVLSRRLVINALREAGIKIATGIGKGE